MADEVKTEPTKKSADNNKMILIVVAVVVGLFVLWKFVLNDNDTSLSDGYSENFAENIIKSTTGADIDYDADSGSVNVKTDEGEFSSGTSEKLPDNFPSEVTVYDNQKVVSSYSTTSESGTVWYVSAQTDASVDDVKNFFTDKYSDWDNKSTATYNGTSTQSYEKGTMLVTLIITPAGEGYGNDKTTITYSVTNE